MLAGVSLKEAAAIAEVREPVLRKAIEAGFVRPEAVGVGRSHRHRFRARDLLFVKLVTSFPWDLPREDKSALAEIIERKRDSAGRWHARGGLLVADSPIGEVRVDLSSVQRRLAERFKAYVRARRRVASDPAVMGGEPVFAGTRIPVAHVAGLIAKKVPLEEIAEDYPSLAEGDLLYASMLAAMKPNPGRPRKRLALVRGGQPVTTSDRAVARRAAPAR